MEKNEEFKFKTALYFKAEEFHQSVYELSSDWNIYHSNEHTYIKRFISHAIGATNKEDNDYSALTDKIYSEIVEHGIQSTEDNTILCNVLYNVTFDHGALDNINNIDSLHNLLNIYPIFKVKKNFENNIEPQTWYIDTETRIYESWKDYINNNNLPQCIMITPKDGIYQANLKELWSDDASLVWIEYYDKKNLLSGVISTLDTTSTVANTASLLITTSALLFAPISTPVLASVGAVGSIAGFWTGIRSINHLIDRSNHHQSIINKESFKLWFDVANSSFGLMAAGSSALLSNAIRKGTSISNVAQIAHDTVIISNTICNTCSIVVSLNDLAEKYNKTKEISATDIFFLCTHLFFYYNCVINTKLAADIIKSDQIQIIKDYENSLRYKKHRKEFRRLIRNTADNIPNDVQLNTEIIRSINEISNKDEFFSLLAKNRKIFNEAETKVSFSNGHVKIDDLNLMSSSEFISTLKVNLNKNNIILTNKNITAAQIINKTPFEDSNAHIRTNALQNNQYLQKFCTQNKIILLDFCSKLSNILGSIKYDVCNSINFKNLLIPSLKLVKKYMEDDSVDVTKVFNHALNFIWKLIKKNIEKQFPCIDIIIDAAPYVYECVIIILQKITKQINEWYDAFKYYVNKVQTLFSTSNTLDPELIQYLNRDFKENNHKIFLNPKLISNEISATDSLITLALFITNSNMKNSTILNKEISKLYEDEFNEYVLKYPISFNFKIDDLIQDIVGILMDIQNFDKKNIIFYKLIAISINILNLNDIIQKNTLVNVIQFIWTLLIIHLSKTNPEENIFSNKFEDLIISIFINTYENINNDREKWLKAFNNYIQYLNEDL